MIADIPNVKGKASFTAFYGVRLEYKPEDGKKLEPVRKQVHACRASQGCRTTAKILKITPGSTTGATNHLEQEHSITSESSAAQQHISECSTYLCVVVFWFGLKCVFLLFLCRHERPKAHR